MGLSVSDQRARDAREVRRIRLMSDIHLIVLLLAVETLLAMSGWVVGWIAVTTHDMHWVVALAVIMLASLAAPAAWSVLFSRLVVTIIPGDVRER